MQDSDELWSKIHHAVRSDFLITSQCFIEWKGLVAGHGYIVKDFVLITKDDGSEIRLVKVKNPWKTIGDATYKTSSHGDWTGSFSKNDTASWTADIKKKAKFD